MQGDKQMGCFQSGNFPGQKWDREVVRQWTWVRELGRRMILGMSPE